MNPERESLKTCPSTSLNVLVPQGSEPIILQHPNNPPTLQTSGSGFGV